MVGADTSSQRHHLSSIQNLLFRSVLRGRARIWSEVHETVLPDFSIPGFGPEQTSAATDGAGAEPLHELKS